MNKNSDPTLEKGTEPQEKSPEKSKKSPEKSKKSSDKSPSKKKKKEESKSKDVSKEMDQLYGDIDFVDNEEPSGSRKRKRDAEEKLPKSNLSPRKKLKTKINLSAQIEEEFKKKLGLYAHLKPHRIIKKLLKEAPDHTKRYGTTRKEFVNICLSKMKDDLDNIFETLIKKHKITGDNVTLEE